MYRFELNHTYINSRLCIFHEECFVHIPFFIPRNQAFLTIPICFDEKSDITASFEMHDWLEINLTVFAPNYS